MSQRKIVVIGCGHVGLITAVGFAELGHDVVGVETDPHKVALLKKGRSHFYEPGVEELLVQHLSTRLRFTSDIRPALDGADLVFICVNTPPLRDGRLSLAYVEAAARSIAEAATGPLVVVEKSTVPVRTSMRIAEILAERGTHGDFEVASNPEVLRAGRAL